MLQQLVESDSDEFSSVGSDRDDDDNDSKINLLFSYQSPLFLFFITTLSPTVRKRR